MSEFAKNWLQSCFRTGRDPGDAVAWIRDNIPLGSMVADLYPPVEGRGRTPHDRAAMTVAYLYMQTEGIQELSALAERLESDDEFADRCGFDLNKRRPHRSTLSRHFARLADADFASRLQERLVEKAIALGLVEGNAVAIDSAEIAGREAFVRVPKPTEDMTKSQKRRWEERQAKQRLEEAFSLRFEEQVAKLPTHADFGRKRSSKGRIHQWFGYKVHVATDAGEHEIPLMALLTSASCHDMRVAYPLAAAVREKLPQLDYEYGLYDEGYDGRDLYIFHNHYGQRMIAELNWRTAQPPMGFDRNLHPKCPAGLAYRYHSYDPKYDTMRFREPGECGDECCCWFDHCPARERKIKVNDARLHAVPPRGSAKFKALYARRTVVERTMGGIKDAHLGNGSFLKGHPKKSLWVGFALAAWTARKIVLGLQSKARGRPRLPRHQLPLPEQLRLDRHAAPIAAG